MKKLSLLLIVLMTCLMQVDAQDFVSTEPQKKNVLIEEFTGRGCQNCPDGHIIANAIHNSYPDRVSLVSIHSQSGLSPASYPNLNTSLSATIFSAFDGSSIPTAVINRSTADKQSRTAWSALAGEELMKDAIVNVDGVVMIDEATRMATIIVEAYYTGDSESSTNYLTIYMVQDNILGYQSNGSNNPSQVVDGTYSHMHVLRSAVTPTWGDEVTTTTAGTLIKKTYSYEIPSTIGSPNGVDVNIDDVNFVAFVSEKYQGTPTRPVLNVKTLKKVQGTYGNIAPVFIDAKQTSKISCSSDNSFFAKVLNVGVTTLESFKIDIKLDGEKVDEYIWEGSLEQYASASIDFNIDVAVGEHELTLDIVEANGQDVNESVTIDAVSKSWTTVETEQDEMTLTIDVTQDKYGAQITWEIIDSDMNVIAEGGPYDNLAGSSSTKLHRFNVDVPSDECLRFIIRDSQGNGICCNYGDGSYKIKGNNTVLVDGDGAFGAEASHDLSIVKTIGVDEHNSNESYQIFPNPTKNVINIEGDDMAQIIIYNSLGQIMKSVECDAENVTVDVNNFDEGIYFVNIINKDGGVSVNKVSVIR